VTPDVKITFPASGLIMSEVFTGKLSDLLSGIFLDKPTPR